MNPTPSMSPAAVKVRLLQDAIYSDDSDLWATLLRHRANIENYFQGVGLSLVVHDEDGFAYLKQSDQEDSDGIPRLFRRDKLTKGVAIVGVVLREQLLQFDENIHDESRLILRKAAIIQFISPFFPRNNNEPLADKRIENYISKAEELGLIRKLPGGDGDERYEVRRVIKARFPAETLKALREQLEAHANTRDTQH